MEIQPQIRDESDKENFQVEVRSGGKLIGFANFFRTVVNGIHAWGARVDVKEKYKRKSVATTALRAGDKHIKKRDPKALRVFEDLNSIGYSHYLNDIPEENLVDVTEEGKIIFKP